jgi:hypothetical protein
MKVDESELKWMKMDKMNKSGRKWMKVDKIG